PSSAPRRRVPGDLREDARPELHLAGELRPATARRELRAADCLGTLELVDGDVASPGGILAHVALRREEAGAVADLRQVNLVVPAVPVLLDPGRNRGLDDEQARRDRHGFSLWRLCARHLTRASAACPAVWRGSAGNGRAPPRPCGACGAPRGGASGAGWRASTARAAPARTRSRGKGCP